MKISQRCAACLMAKQREKTSDAEYLSEVQQMLDQRTDEDCSPYMAYRFEELYARRFGKGPGYAKEKKRFNDLVMAMEEPLRARIEAAEDPLAASLVLARTGNYVDFAALGEVDADAFLAMLGDLSLKDADLPTYESLLETCKSGKRFLLVADNCGEIALDKLFLEQLKKRFPALELNVMVRGGEAFNDATEEDARYVGIDRIARIVSNGSPIGGMIYRRLSPEARAVLDSAEVVLAKGQANYESMCGEGRHVFYAFLCKCELFMERFRVPRLTGMLVEER